ncbi:MAG: serine hydrolase domain-containing protein [Gemmatimonadota bacterium]
MRRSGVMILAAGCVAAGAASPAAAQESHDGLDPADIARIEALVGERIEAQGIPGLSIAVVADGRIAWSRGFGLADVENEVPATPRTAYRTASIGKPMTAVAVLRLAARGRLDLDAPVQRYCPAFPDKGSPTPVTARRLLAHMGGIRHYEPQTQEEETYSTTHYESVVEALASFADDPLAYEPGTASHYSTFGYNLLGCAIEGASGMPYLRYMADSVFAVAGMSATRDDDPRAIIPHRAGGYTRDSTGALGNARFTDMSNRLPAGGFVTTAEDLARFAIAFMDDRLLADSTRRAMLEPQRTTSGEVVPFGLGWGLFPGEEWYGLKEAFHGGQTPGVSGMLYLIPERRFAVALLSNLQGMDERVDLSARIAVIVLDLEAP